MKASKSLRINPTGQLHYPPLFIVKLKFLPGEKKNRITGVRARDLQLIKSIAETDKICGFFLLIFYLLSDILIRLHDRI